MATRGPARTQPAPVSYGVFEITCRPREASGRASGPGRGDGRMQGYAGSELVAARILRPQRPVRSASCWPRTTLELVGSFVPLRFSRDVRLRRGPALAYRRDARSPDGGLRGPGAARRAALGRVLRAGPHALRGRNRGASRGVDWASGGSVSCSTTRTVAAELLPRARLRDVVPPARRHLHRDSRARSRRCWRRWTRACSACLLRHRSLRFRRRQSRWHSCARRAS